MGKKIALLIGVSEYEPGLNQLPGAVNDVDGMQRVLANPEMGGFAENEIIVLKNPQPQIMREAIEKLFASRQKDDLLLFYFSGHGIKDDAGRLYLSTRATRKEKSGLVKSTSIEANFLHGNINESKSQRQVIILDCCFSGAIAQGMSVKDDGNVDVQQQLGGKGRAILTSSTSTQYSFEQEGSEFSVYTRYIIEGIEKGAADKDGDGYISVDELHEYASVKVQEVSPAMTPKFYPVEEGHKILLAKSPKDDPKLKYRKEVESRLHRGKFSIPARRLLNSLRTQLKLSIEVTTAIEEEVLQPFKEYQRKLQEYEETLIEAIENEATLSERTLNDLRDYQKHLGLTDNDVAPIVEKIIGHRKKIEEELRESKEVVSPSQSPAKSSPSTTIEDKAGIELSKFEFEFITVNVQGKPSDSTSGQAEYFTEDLGNGVTIEMVAIPGGTFMMGSPENEPKRSSDESPQHKVTIQPFFMGKYAITQKQWAAVATFPKVKIDLQSDPSRFKGGNLPVETISWNEANEFCARLSQHCQKHSPKRNYRLPSEAEWEYACRAGTTTPFHFGDTITTELANYNGNYTYGSAPTGEYRRKTTEVGTFPPNAFGLCDMHGNVWEWCEDDWHNNYNSVPSNGTAWRLGDNNPMKLLRGGSWDFNPVDCRSTNRNFASRDNHSSNYSFRLVL
jgi:formylglycine-generating enzyme required for sulfatase activity